MLKPIIIERTLSGLKRPAMSLYRIEENCAIAGILAHGEIPELLTAIFAMGDEEITLIDATGDINLKPATTISGCSTDTKQIAALCCKAEFVYLSISVSDRYFNHLRLSRILALSLIAYLIRKIEECHTGSSIRMANLARPHPSFLVEVALRPRMYGEQWIQFSNKVGAILQFSAYDLIARLHDVEIYLQHDVGLATAHTLAALNSSAPHVSPAVNGMVHPKGKAALKEVVTGSRHLIEQDTGVDSNTFVQISSLAQDSSHWAVPSKKIRTHMCSHRVRRWDTHSRVSHFDSRLRRCDKHDALPAKTHPHPDYKDSGNSEAVFQDRVVTKMLLSRQREQAPEISSKANDSYS
ncbi:MULTISPECIES: homocitrate synthase [Cupriavidus]|uniref:Homocitrate synthase n=3 Tax=Cupriavidus TaxID=106589 RepID=A0A375HXX3_9BURK|nr:MULTISPECIES: homocitrate synthase [Cupriavidus]MCO4865805.1 homocitrate synthase [Cupriavidus sp. WGlv3]MCO4893488.1 homocitrate synthase [Cupriavidus sp. WGtm5]CAP64038.1 Homocitrate synthase [Cupriavidus taiwanensis LMG 19424]SOY74971.1 Homocitrate synthase [Cupriavidus taiwanensis]SOY74984.1 Homocitrate synthase [Cupriavidus taiwanensis]